MTTSFGPILDQWSALVMDAGKLAETIDRAAENNIKLRGLSNVSIYRSNVTTDPKSLGAQYRPALVVQQSLGRGGQATVALTVTRHGAQDLDVAWFVCAKNDLNQITGNAVGVLGILVGSALALSGIIVSLMGFRTGDIGWGLLTTAASATKVGDKSYPTQENQKVALELAHTVDYCLMRALGDQGIDASQLRVTHAAANVRIGHLASG